MSYAVTFTITLKEPALFTTLDGDPNSAISQDYIPGSALRGMGVGLYMKQHGISDLDAASPSIQALFFDGRVRWLNAYPANETTRMLPVPRNWSQPKYGESSNIFVQPHGNPPEGSKPKTPKGFVTCIPDGVRLHKPKRTIKIHVQRNRKLGRAVSDSGAVYRYEGLATGQRFIGVVLCNDEVQAAEITRLFEGVSRVVMGGARSAGYGTCELSDVSDPIKDWREFEFSQRSKALVAQPKEPTIRYVTLLSDVIVRDADGQIRADLPTLAYALGITDLDCVSGAYIETDVMGGFNRKWGLPLPQMPVIKAGSVLVIKAAIAPEKIETGIGERRSEGFGRITTQWIPAYQFQITKETENARVEHKPLPPPPDAAKAVIRRLMLEQLEYASIADAQQITFGKQQSLNRSQISRLRGEVRARLAGGLDDNFKDFFSQLRDTARKQFEKQRIAGLSVPKWIEGVKIASRQGAVHARFVAVWTDNDTKQANLLLIDAVLANLYKESKKDAQQDVKQNE